MLLSEFAERVGTSRDMVRNIMARKMEPWVRTEAKKCKRQFEQADIDALHLAIRLSATGMTFALAAALVRERPSFARDLVIVLESIKEA